MNITLGADPRRWLALPAEFPTPDGLDRIDWENAVLTGVREAWEGRLDARAEALARQALRRGLESVDASDSITLQFWPDASIANVVVHITAGLFDADEPRPELPVPQDVTFVTPPAIDTLEAPGVGTGVEARYLVAPEGASRLAVGGVGYLFQNARAFILVRSEPTFPVLLGHMLDPLREVVRSLAVRGDDEEPWQTATVGPDVLERPGEEWTFDGISEAKAPAEPLT